MYHRHLVAVSEFVNGGELLGLCQSYGLLPEELVRIYVAEISLAIGKFFFFLACSCRQDLFILIHENIFTFAHFLCGKKIDDC